MTRYIGYRDGGQTNEQGLKEELFQLFTAGVPTTNSSTSGAVSQRGAGANMSVDVAVGDFHMAKTSYSYWGWTDAIENVTINASDPTNPRRDIIVAYVDLTVVDPTLSNNPNALKMKSVAGTPAGSPNDPSDPTIQTSVGAGNPWIKLARVQVGAAATSIVNANITDLRTPIQLKARLRGGASNTNGHTVPNVADDTVALLAATQTFTNKTMTAPTLNTPVISLWDGWQALGSAPNTVTDNGNNSYSLVFNSVNLTTRVSKGMRLKLNRTVTAPTMSTLLDGVTQYYSKTSPAAMTFVDDFVCSAWVKLTSYQDCRIASRYNGTSGWEFGVDNNGRLFMQGRNGGAGNLSTVISYQSLPLNKWIHVAAQLDMSAFTATSTTSYVMFDGVDVPATVSRTGTNPTALIQAGDLEIGSQNGGGTPFPGTIAQVAIYSAKVAQATVAATRNQTLTGSETNLISAYSFNNSVNDLKVANANNLTANGSAVATNADTPFANGTGGIIEYGIVMSSTFSVNTTFVVQVPNNCALPTTGGISSVSYSVEKVPYNFPAQKARWELETIWILNESVTVSGYNDWFASHERLIIPIGDWMFGWSGTVSGNGTIGNVMEFYFGLANAAVSAVPDTRTVCQALTGPTTTFESAQSPPGPVGLSLSAATTYTLMGAAVSAAGTVTWNTNNTTFANTANRIYATNAFI